MKTLLAFLMMLFLSTPAWAGPWTTIGTVELSKSSTSTTIELGEKLGKIDNLRFQIEGQTVRFTSLKAFPVKGSPIELKVAEYLKSGESSGLINIPGAATTLASLTIGYTISSETSTPAKLTLRIKTD